MRIQRLQKSVELACTAKTTCRSPNLYFNQFRFFSLLDKRTGRSQDLLPGASQTAANLPRHIAILYLQYAMRRYYIPIMRCGDTISPVCDATQSRFQSEESQSETSHTVGMPTVNTCFQTKKVI